MQSQERPHLQGEEEVQQSPSLNIETEDDVTGSDYPSVDAAAAAAVTATGIRNEYDEGNPWTSGVIFSSHQRNK